MGRANKLDEHLHKLNKYREAVNSKKQQRNELINERVSVSNMKLGAQINQSPSDIVTQRMEDRTGNVVLNKRVRTSVTKSQAECRNNSISRQSLVMAKDRDMLKDSGTGSDLAEENIRRLPAGGEGWDKKMKRKRSVGTSFMRSTESDGDQRRAMHHKLGNEPTLQSCDPRSFRSGSANGFSSISKMDNSSSAGSNAHGMPKNEQDKAAFPRDLTVGLNKDRLLAKGSNKLNIREDNNVLGPSPLTKGKASRAPRSGSSLATNPSPNISRVSGALESWEHTPSGNKIYSVGGADSRKRSIALVSSSSPMAQWVGQRPQKNSRTRRANLVSPVSNHDDAQMSSEGCSLSDVGAGETSIGTHGLLISRGQAKDTQKFKVRLETASSPVRFSGSEESGHGEYTLKKKGLSGIEVEEKALNAIRNVESSLVLTKKKLLSKEEIGDGVRRQGRNGRAFTFSRASISPFREKLESTTSTKPLRSTRPGTDKTGSKSGRPLKKTSDRKGFSRLAHTPSSSSPDFTGESDDDREELLAAAKFACKANYHACSSLFWKKMEPIFASVNLEDASYLSQELKTAEKLHEDLSQMLSHSNDILVDSSNRGKSVHDTLVGEIKNRTPQNKVNVTNSARTQELVDQLPYFDSSWGKPDSEEGLSRTIPLYQRVLTALIADDEIEEFEDNGMEGNVQCPTDTDDSYVAGCYSIDVELRKMDNIAFEHEAVFSILKPKQPTSNRYHSCNGSSTSNRSLGFQSSSFSDELLPSNAARYVHSDVGVFNGTSKNDLNGPQTIQANGFGMSSFDSQYEQMGLDDKLLLELHSIGLCVGSVPDLYDREDEVINQDIVQLKRALCQQIGKKKECVDKIYRAIHGGKEAVGRNLELVAMNRLVELAYKKLLATRGTSASRTGVPKVSKQVALAFAKRTLARCRKFEDSGTSCFSEPALQDVLFAAPPRGSLSADFEWTARHNKMDQSFSDIFQSYNSQSDQAFAKSGGTTVSNRGGKKNEVVLLDDDVGGSAAAAASRGAPSPLGGGGTKGKRSERGREKESSTSMKSGIAKASSSRPLTKLKPKQKTGQLLSASTTDPVLNPSAHNYSGEFATMSPAGGNDVGGTSSKEIEKPVNFGNMELHELAELDVDTGIGTGIGGGAPQDLGNWLNLDDDGLQEHDSAGLEIPMDDLFGITMY